MRLLPVVITTVGLAAAALPQEQRRKAILIGLAAAEAATAAPAALQPALWRALQKGGALGNLFEEYLLLRVAQGCLTAKLGFCASGIVFVRITVSRS